MDFPSRASLNIACSLSELIFKQCLRTEIFSQYDTLPWFNKCISCSSYGLIIDKNKTSIAQKYKQSPLKKYAKVVPEFRVIWEPKAKRLNKFTKKLCQ